MKNNFIGLLLSFQFFSSVPIRKQLSMNEKSVSAMFYLMPILGSLMGASLLFLKVMNDEFFQFSPLFMAIILVVAGIIMTGGLHLDGWIDMSDAYFSYQDQERRLAILDDSRVGAFGVISLFILILLKVGFLYEVIDQNKNNLFLFFLMIPFLSRIALLLYFLTTPNGKEKGLAVYFKSQVNDKKIWTALIIYTVLFFVVTYYFLNVVGLILFIAMIIFVFIYRNWTIKNFGGMTGDLLGAIYEAMEVILWGIVLLSI
ncbi:adenosylcobinamide-GDP ribazoletransferase [Ureibacillus sp. Re31]|uniref:Adenosylcobinamide-GDP ribazoletransferase n=1 Tax=Ureibacillus galli TaxID=2762222 RepID=A0ABR8XEP9_9BACL|nr:adenosylcobinamide-GDP ribazoletransferase [Ureibacillus galli]MBD8027717.1 adenosylcobinamide-GDP ribazoletransferase [Ureibacillus galli]